MRTTAFAALLVSTITLSDAIEFAELLRFTSAFATTACATPGSTPDSYVPIATSFPDGPVAEPLDLRQAPAVLLLPAAPPLNQAVPNANANPAALATAPAPTIPVNPVDPAKAPANVPANPPAVAPAAPAIPSVPPAAVPLTPILIPEPPIPTHDPSVSVTVQWVETWIGGTSRTWVPRTITLRNQALSGAAPLPGKGEIGMGTLTGHLGVTKTVIKGAAKTVGPEWKVGAVAAMGVGIAGLV